MRIVIVGGGVGGLSAAVALRREGFEPQVFEQAPALLEVGAAIAVWPNAMRVLRRLGRADAVARRGRRGRGARALRGGRAVAESGGGAPARASALVRAGVGRAETTSSRLRLRRLRGGSLTAG